MNESILMQLDSPQGMKRLTYGSGGQSSMSHEAEGRFGDLAEALFWTFFSRVGFLLSQSA